MENKAEGISQSAAKSVLKEALLSGDKKIISISGKRGIGKSTVFKLAAAELEGFGWIYGKCTSLTQLTPGGLLQDVLFNLFELPNFCVYDPKFKKSASKFIKNGFENLSDKEISDLINFLYPLENGDFEDIFANKNYTFTILNKIFDKIFTSGKFVFVVDNFDFIDGFSYEFLYNFFKKDNISPRLKFIVLYNEPHPVRGYFYFPDDSIYLDILLAPFDMPQLEALTEQKTGTVEGFLPYENMTELLEISRGNPAYIENALALYFESMIFDKSFELSPNFSGIVRQRLQILADVNPLAYDTLVAAAILGDKVNLALLGGVLEIGDEEFRDVVDYLEKSDFIMQLNDFYYEFKSLILWETVCTLVPNSYNFEGINRTAYSFLTNFTMNSYAFLGLITQNLREIRTAFDIWTKNARICAYIGDVSLYSMSQKQCLALINEFNDDETLNIRFKIHERLGKLLSVSNPHEAVDYLPDVISHAHSTGDDAKEIELLAYMSSCCRVNGNYFGEVECVDAVIEKIPAQKSLDLALLNTTKLHALLNIGNCGQIINLIDNDIMPDFERHFSQKTKDPDMNFVFESWMKTYLVLANALVLQGSERAFEVVNILFDIIERYKITEELFVCKCKIALACAHTIRGDLKSSNEILSETLEAYKANVMDSETLLRWNLLNLINRFIRKEYDGIQEELFNVAAYANNVGGNFTKNILKTLLGKVFKDNGQTKQAMEIYNEQVSCFANEKIASGALLTWYMIADAALITDGADAAIDIASRALDVAQNPKVDNYIFAILLRGVIARASMAKTDFETAKIHIETAIALAKKCRLNDLLADLYLLYGDYFRELALEPEAEQDKYLEGAAKMYELAADITKETKNSIIYARIKESQNILISFYSKRRS